jgi:hypothetical protein
MRLLSPANGERRAVRRLVGRAQGVRTDRSHRQWPPRRAQVVARGSQTPRLTSFFKEHIHATAQ